MNHKRLVIWISLALMLLLAACSPAKAAPTPIVIVVTATNPPATATTVPPTATATSTSAPPTATATTAPVILAGPPMQVGSTYLYFDGTLLVAVPGGPFIMGSGNWNNPQHTVTLGDFWIYSTKVTNREYQQCVAASKCTLPDSMDNLGYNEFMQQNNPVTGVAYEQGAAYCGYAHGQLPTEAQWEKTARGSNGNIYPWGSGAPSGNLLNYNDIIRHTTNVINYPQGKSYYDALDMEGNVYEWVYDWYDPFYYHTGPAQDPLGPDSAVNENRSVRSAGYRSNADQVVASTRYYKHPTDDASDLGFRCVVKDPTYFAPMCQLTPSVGPNLGGTASGGTANPPYCPNIGVSVAYFGCGAKAAANLNFTDDAPGGDPNWDIVTGPGCSSVAGGSSFPKQSTCTNIPPGGFDVSISSKCTWSANQTPALACPVHYNLVNGGCVWDGSGTAGQQCPAGTQYDPAHKCCTTASGSAANFPACPAGTFFTDLGGGKFACLPGGSTGNVNPASAHVDKPTNPCGSGSNNQCPSGQKWTCTTTGCSCQ